MWWIGRSSVTSKIRQIGRFMAKSSENATVHPPVLGIYSGQDLMGDGLFKLPFFRAARAAFPDYRIVYVTSGPTMLETKLRPLVSGIIDVFISNTGICRSIGELIRPLPIQEKFSVFIDTQPVLWRTLLLRRLRHDLFITPAAHYRLSDRRPSEGRVRPVNITLRLIELIELASGRPVDMRLDVAVPPDFLEKARRQCPLGSVYVGLAPGAGGRGKCWPLENYIALARKLVDAGRIPVFVLGPAELEWLPQIREAVPRSLFPLQDEAVWGGGYDPVATVALARSFAAAVSNDSGTNHMFAAANIPLLTLFGPSNAEKFRPLVKCGVVLKAQDFGGSLPSDIPVSAVESSLETLLSSDVSSSYN
ncbi:Heptosyltransferase [Azospirillaceae bacterium]